MSCSSCQELHLKDACRSTRHCGESVAERWLRVFGTVRSGFRVQGFRVSVLGFRVQSLGFRGLGSLGFRG